MRIAYFSCQMPFPATHGGLVDDWARLNAFKKSGADLFLVTWYADGPAGVSPEQMQALQSVAKQVCCVPIGRTFAERVMRLMRLRKYPSHVASRILPASKQKALWQQIDQFEPEAIWLDALYPTVMAFKAARRYGVPLFYRSHNIEHRYMRGQVERAASWRDKLAWSLNLPHLKSVEFETWRQANAVFDISLNDIEWWRQHGLDASFWLPPLVHPDKTQALSMVEGYRPDYDVAYLGNLRTPNNVEGILWFLQKVWPVVLKQKPEAKFLLAGSSPVEAVKAAVAAAPQVTLLASPPDVVPVLRSSKVLVNPVFGGSGVNVKSVEMLFSPATLISTTQGVAGLPESVVGCFSVHDEPDAFAQAIVHAVQTWQERGEHGQARQLARQQFSYDKIQDVLKVMAEAAS